MGVENVARVEFPGFDGPPSSWPVNPEGCTLDPRELADVGARVALAVKEDGASAMIDATGQWWSQQAWLARILREVFGPHYQPRSEYGRRQRAAGDQASSWSLAVRR